MNAPRNPSEHVEQSYPLQIKFPLRSIDFGVRTGENEMKSMKTVLPVKGHDLSLEVNTRAKALNAYFSIPSRSEAGNGIRRFKIKVDIAQLKTIYRTSLDNDHYALVVSLSLPPRYFFKNRDVRDTISADLKIWSNQDTWNRATDVAENLEIPSKYPIALHNEVPDPEYMEIGRWTTFRFVVEDSDMEGTEASTLIKQLRYALEDLNVSYEDSPNFVVSPGAKSVLRTRLDHPPIPPLGGALALMQSASQPIHLEFPVRYQLEVCLSRGLLNEHALSVDFVLKLADMTPTKARLRLEYLADQEVELRNPMTLFSNPDADAYYPNTSLPHYCALMRKATITPTTIRFNMPVAETSNRVLRRYNLLQDRFLRVQLLEESEKGRIGVYKEQDKAIYERLRRAMYQGIQIGDRRYEFLAFGNSQLRECGAYFFCPTNNASCNDIRNWMGQFDHIKVVASTRHGSDSVSRQQERSKGSMSLGFARSPTSTTMGIASATVSA